MSNPQERYQNLEIAESLSISYRYPMACTELGFILRASYGQLPKDLQSSIFRDTVAAFRLLPEMQTQGAVSAANFLIQAAEAALPKQKKNMAVTEFKHAKIAYKRLSKMHKEEQKIDCAHLPHDVLLHVLSSLDFHSLVSAGLVSRSWKLAASDNTLWQSQYAKIFGHSSECIIADVDWKGTFQRTYREKLSKAKRLVSSRGYCRPCQSFFWIDSSVCLNRHLGPDCSHDSIKRILPQQVVDYLLDELSSSDSDSDSDSDTETANRLWSYQKFVAH